MRINSRLMRLEQAVGAKEAPLRPLTEAEWLAVFHALSADEKMAMLRSPVWVPPDRRPIVRAP